MPAENSLTADVPVSTIEKPLSVTIPNNNTAGTCYIGTRASESDPWHYSLVTDGTNSNARFMRLSAIPPKTCTFDLYRLNIQLRLFAFNNENSDKGEVDSVALSTGSEDNKITAKDGKYAEDLQIKVTLSGDKLDSFKADGLAARIIYRSQNQTPAQLKANGSIVKQNDSDDKAVTGGYEHSFEISNITVDSQMSGEAVLSFVLNLNGVSIEDFPTDFLVEFYSDTKDEKTLPFTYTQLFSFATKEEQVNPDPEPQPEPGFYALSINTGTGIATVEGAGNYKPDESVTVKCSIKDGYEFDSWSGDKTGNSIELTFNMPENNVTLTANAKVITYNIAYDLAGGKLDEGVTNPTTYDVTTADITLNNPTKNGYEFTGWSGTGLTGNNNTTVTISKGSIGEREFTANYAIANYTIAYKNSDGSDLTTTNPTSYNVESDKITLTNPTRNGYEFLGWTYEGQTTPTTSVTIPHGSTGAKAFTAHFKKIVALAIAADDGVIIDDVNSLYYTKATFTITPTLGEGVTMTDSEKANILSAVSVKDTTGTSFGNATATWNNDGKIALSFLKDLTASTTFTISFGEADDITITCQPKTFKTFYFKGKGATDNRYQIESAEQLDCVRNYLDKHFVQIADIDLGAYTENWTAIGIDLDNPWNPNPFIGSYYGNGYKIKNLTIHTSDMCNCVGLFGKIGDISAGKSSEIAGITIDGVSIRGANADEPINGWVGIIVGILDGADSSIKDCVVTNSSGKNEVIGNYIAGICYNIYGASNAIFKNCTVENCDFKCSKANTVINIYGITTGGPAIEACHVENVNISCSNFSEASIFGISQNGKSFTGCTVKNTSIICETTVNNSFIEIGGICRNISETIDGCSVANTTIKAVSTKNLRIGGICCNQNGSGNNLKNSKVENSVLTASGTQGYIGGIAGWGNNGTIDNCYISGTKVYCEDLDNSDGNEFQIGGIIGSSGQNNKIESCYVTKSTSSASIVQGTGKSIYVGGIAGYAMGSAISKCCVKDDTTVSGNGDYSEIGGICGEFSYSFGEVVLSSCFVKDTSVSCTGNEAYFGGICGLTDSMTKLSACYFYEKDANHTITTSGTDYTFGYLVGDLNGKVYDSFTNKSTTNLVGNIDDNDEPTSGDIINCYSGVGDKDTFSGKSWTANAWNDYNTNSFPPTLNQN